MEFSKSFKILDSVMMYRTINDVLNTPTPFNLTGRLTIVLTPDVTKLKSINIEHESKI